MADNSVRTNTPDPTKYHPNTGGMPGTMLPRAGKDGQSLGFDPNRPRAVIVDPGEIGGGFTIDLAELSKLKTNFNSAAVRHEVASDVSSFYRELSQRMAEPPEPEAVVAAPLPLKETRMAEPLKPLGNLPPVPSFVKPLPSPEDLQPVVDEIEQLLQSEYDKAAEMRRQFNPPPVQSRAPSSYEESQLHGQLAQQAKTINAMIERINLITPPPAPKVELPITPEVTPSMHVASAFASLQIPFLLGERAERPQYETYFEMPRMGTMAARYHAVVAGQDCLALIYDTRFADGFQYLPPNLGEEQITVSVPKLKETYVCSSLGLHWSIGCLDVVILICHKGEV